MATDGNVSSKDEARKNRLRGWGPRVGFRTKHGTGRLVYTRNVFIGFAGLFIATALSPRSAFAQGHSDRSADTELDSIENTADTRPPCCADRIVHNENAFARVRYSSVRMFTEGENDSHYAIPLGTIFWAQGRISNLYEYWRVLAIDTAAQASARRPTRVPCTTEITASPVTTSEHARCFAAVIFDWKTVVSPSVTAGIAQLSPWHDGFTSDWSGYGQHVGVNILNNVTGKFFGNFALPAIFHQDERIVRLGSASRWQDRMVHVLTHVFVTGSADHSSSPVFNASALPGCAISAMISNLYEPHQVRTVSATAERFGWNLGGFVGGDAYSEFQPDLEGRLEWLSKKIWPR